MFRYLPEQASELAHKVDQVNNFITDVSVFFTVAVVGVMCTLRQTGGTILGPFQAPLSLRGDAVCRVCVCLRACVGVGRACVVCVAPLCVCAPCLCRVERAAQRGAICIDVASRPRV